MRRLCKTCGVTLSPQPREHWFQRGEDYWCPEHRPEDWEVIGESGSCGPDGMDRLAALFNGDAPPADLTR